MRTIVYGRDFEELEIKPRPALDEYRTRTAHDVGKMLNVPGKLQERSCPGCRSARTTAVFEKFGLKYRECTDCHSVFVSPCPEDAAIVEFYRNSDAARFWRDHLSRETGQARRLKVYRPLAEWILAIVDRHRPRAFRAIDVGYHSNVLLEELSGKAPLQGIVAANPVADIECGRIALPDVHIQPVGTAELHKLGPADVVSAFDVVSRTADLEEFFVSVKQALAPGALLLLTTTSISGFDLQVLWDRSPDIYPPDRLNLLSAEGIRKLCERHGFEMLEFSTPGSLDVDIVRRALAENPDIPCTRFVKYVLENREEDAIRDLQEYLQRYRLSSYVRVALRNN